MKPDNGQPNPPRNPSGYGGIGRTVPDDWVPEYDGLGRCGECGNVHSPNDECPPPVSGWKHR